MKRIDHTYQTLYSELAQRSLDAWFASDFPADGRFVPVTVKQRRYWYFDRRLPATGATERTYVGPADDPEISSRVETFKDLKADVRARRKLVSTLVREAYLPRPDPMAGEIVQALAQAGLFRLRGVLVGTVAFQTYSAILGVRLPNTVMQTADADFAQFHAISAAVGDELPPILEVLRAVDPTFREIPHQMDSRHATRFAARSGYQVEFLTPHTGSADLGDRPAPMPALGGAAAQPLRFLDYLIHQPVRAVLLHGAGISVLVPAPERYAVHKLIVGSRRKRADRDSMAKAGKDRQQAETLMLAMLEAKQGDALAEAWMEAWQRGPAWREAIQDSLRSLDEKSLTVIREGLGRAITALEDDPGEYGLRSE